MCNKVEKLKDSYSSAVKGDFDYMVVSPETEPVAKKINKIRYFSKPMPVLKA